MSHPDIRIVNTLNSTGDWLRANRTYVREGNLCLTHNQNVTSGSLGLVDLDGAMDPSRKAARVSFLLLYELTAEPALHEWLSTFDAEPRRVWDACCRLLPTAAAPVTLFEGGMLHRTNAARAHRTREFNPFALSQLRPLAKLPRGMNRPDLLRALAAGQFEDMNLEQAWPVIVEMDLPESDPLHRWGTNALAALEAVTRSLGDNSWKLHYDVERRNVKLRQLNLTALNVTLAC